MPSLKNIKILIYRVNNLLTKWPCHRIPERCLKIGTWHMPVCSRCLGIILSFPLGVIVGCSSAFSSRVYVFSFCIPLLLDAGLQQTGSHKSNNYFRLITGLLAGFGAGIFLLLGLKQDINYFF